MPTCERFPPCSAIAISRPASFTRPFNAVRLQVKAPGIEKKCACQVRRLLTASQAPCRPTCSSAPVSTVSSEACRNGSKLDRKEPLKTMGSWPSRYASALMEASLFVHIKDASGRNITMQICGSKLMMQLPVWILQRLHPVG